MAKSSLWLYLPIDVKVREIEAKTFLALRAARRGYNVVIGQKQKFPSILSCYPAGHYLGFGAIENFKKEYKNLHRRGHGIILQDEEGLVTHSEAMYIRSRLDPETLALGEIFVAWGQAQADLFTKHRPQHTGILSIAGNSRFDVLRPEQRFLYDMEVRKLKEAHGDFILINSNFGSCNHYMGAEKYLQSLRDKKIIRNEADFDYYSRYFAYRRIVMQEILKALPALRAAFPDTRIIIRPHPSENVDTWKKHTGNLGNIHVIHEGSPVPWLLAAGAILHNFCTTSLEAFALGLSPIAYRPLIDEALETPLPSLASIEARSQDDLIAAIKFILSGQRDPARSEKTKALSEYIANLEGTYASDTILEKLETLPLQARPLDAAAPLLHTARKAAEKAKVLLTGQGKSSYVTHKFPGLGISEIRDLARRLEKAPGEYAGLRMKKIHDNCVLIRQ
ncbi:MAG: hypothetical protein IT558_05300 [Alphaproteobacteria bacterium]|nr:hypothetical protein [Alphaproteobacteria bacterium]